MTATRRDFLKIAVATGCSLTIGFRLHAVDDEVAVLFRPNAWLQIDADGGISLTVGKSEMGQGIRTTLPMILADELDADWKTVKLVQAMPGPDFQRLGTGGSGSTSGSWGPLRTAGAAAREMLVAAAAAKWNVSPAELKTRNSTVVHDLSGRTLPYRSLVADAAKLPVPETPKLKTSAERTLVGKRTPRIDGREIVQGSAVYGLDARTKGMSYAVIARPPKLGSRLKSFDAARAKKVDGVTDVVATSRGVAVVGTSTWAALKGREALDTTWEDGEHASFDSDEHMKKLEAASRTSGLTTFKLGEGLSLLEGAARKLEASYVSPFHVHAPMEPMNSIADVRDGKCEIWSPTQAPNTVQAEVAALLNIPEANVEVHTTLMGGGFGRRLAIDYALEAAELSNAISKPVQVVWSRDDDFRHSLYQPASIEVMGAGLDAEGKALLLTHKKVCSLHNARRPLTPEQRVDPQYLAGSSWGVFDHPYNFPSIETSYVEVDVPVAIGPWRSVFSPPSVFARESFLDEMAIAMGKDPIELRLSLLRTEANIVERGRMKIDRSRLARVIEVVRDRSGWGSALAKGKGRGIAANTYHANTHIAHVAEVETGPDGGIRVTRIVAAVDCGVAINPLGIEAQIESGAVWALSMALKGFMEWKNGAATASNFRDYPVLRLHETPLIETHIVASEGDSPYGMGEPAVCPVVPAVANAIFAATGQRLRRLPFKLEKTTSRASSARSKAC